MKQRNTAVDLTDLAIGVLILGITVAIGARILSLYASAQRTNLDTITISNESVILNQSSAGNDALANTWVIDISRCVSNITGTGTQPVNSTILEANYTLSISQVDGSATITNATATNFNDAACTYSTYNTTSRVDYTLANDSVLGLAEYGNWFDIIVIVGIAGLILSLIFLAFGNRGQETGVSY